MITADYVKEGAVVIDVGIHRNEENKLCGDVDFEKVEPHTSAITPVPGTVSGTTAAECKFRSIFLTDSYHKGGDHEKIICPDQQTE